MSPGYLVSPQAMKGCSNHGTQVHVGQVCSEGALLTLQGCTIRRAGTVNVSSEK